jgi:hypothetical protein
MKMTGKEGKIDICDVQIMKDAVDMTEQYAGKYYTLFRQKWKERYTEQKEIYEKFLSKYEELEELIRRTYKEESLRGPSEYGQERGALGEQYIIVASAMAVKRKDSELEHVIKYAVIDHKEGKVIASTESEVYQRMQFTYESKKPNIEKILEEYHAITSWLPIQTHIEILEEDKDYLIIGMYAGPKFAAFKFTKDKIELLEEILDP